jgi:hypothetical protein
VTKVAKRFIPATIIMLLSLKVKFVSRRSERYFSKNGRRQTARWLEYLVRVRRSMALIRLHELEPFRTMYFLVISYSTELTLTIWNSVGFIDP